MAFNPNSEDTSYSYNMSDARQRSRVTEASNGLLGQTENSDNESLSDQINPFDEDLRKAYRSPVFSKDEFPLLHHDLSYTYEHDDLIYNRNSSSEDINDSRNKRMSLIDDALDENLLNLKKNLKIVLGDSNHPGDWLPLKTDQQKHLSYKGIQAPINLEDSSNYTNPQINVTMADSVFSDENPNDTEMLGSIKLQSLPVQSRREHPSLELLSPNYPSSITQTPDEMIFNRGSHLELGSAGTRNLNLPMTQHGNNSTQSLYSGNGELRRHITNAITNFSKRVVEGNTSDISTSLPHNRNSVIHSTTTDQSTDAVDRIDDSLDRESIETSEIEVQLPTTGVVDFSQAHTQHQQNQLTRPLKDSFYIKEHREMQSQFLSSPYLNLSSTNLQKVSSLNSSHTIIDAETHKGMYNRDFSSMSYNKKLGLYGNSLKIFGPYNSIRVFFAICLNKVPIILLSLIYISQIVILTYSMWNPEKTYGYYYYTGFTWVKLSLLIINSIYTLEIVMKIISYGFYDITGFYDEFGIERDRTWYEKLKNFLSKNIKSDKTLEKDEENRFQFKHSFTKIFSKPTAISENNLKNLKRPFLHDNWNIIDFTSCVCYWVSFLLEIDQADIKHSLFVFRTLACLRIMKMLRITEGTFTILKSLKHALPRMRDICLFIGYFWILFSLAGVQTFKSSFKRQCQYMDPNNSSNVFIDTNNYQFCGAWLDSNGSPQPYLNQDGSSSGYIKGYFCPKNSKCVTTMNPYNNTVSFDNFFQSLELVFVILSMNTFTDLMYYTMDAENMASSIFYVVAIFILPIWLLNIFVAVIVSSFKIISESHSNNDGGFFNRFFFPINRELPFGIKQRVQTYFRFEIFWVMIILTDFVAQACRHSSATINTIEKINIISMVTTYILFLEILVRFFMYTPYWGQFFRYKRNKFDLALAIITSIIVIPPIREKLGQTYYWLSVFQILRFYRVVVSIKFLKDLWAEILGNVKIIIDLTLFLILILFLYGILSSIYFDGVIDSQTMSENNILLSMYNLPNSLISLYVILSTENWTEVLYMMQQYAKTNFSGAVGSILLIGWFIISNSILLNIFIAVIAQNLDVSEAVKKKEQVKQFIRDLAKRLSTAEEESLLRKLKNKISIKSASSKKKTQKTSESNTEELFKLLMAGTIVDTFIEEEETMNEDKKKDFHNSIWNNWLFNKIWKFFSYYYKKYITNNPFYAGRHTDLEDSINPNNLAKNILMEDKIMMAHKLKYLQDHPGFNKVLYIFDTKNRLRRFCQMFVGPSVGERINGRDPDKRLQDIFNIVMIAGSISIVCTACYATPLYFVKLENHVGWNWIISADVGFAILFSIEAFIKIIADGLLFTPNGILLSFWNIIDMAVLLTLWLNFFFILGDYNSSTKILRGFQAFRALKLLTISDTAKKTFHRIIIAGFRKILGAALVSLCLLLPFSVWGLNIFNGRLSTCNDANMGKSDCSGEFYNTVSNWDVLSPRSYDHPYLYFDNFSSSFSTLFQICSLEGWVDLLEYVTQTTGVGTPTYAYALPQNAIFLVIFMFCAIVFILNMFISVIISNYSKTAGSAYLTTEQLSWKEIEKVLKQAMPSRKINFENFGRLKHWLYCNFVDTNRRFAGLFYNFLLLVQLVILILDSASNSQTLENVRRIILLVNSIIFFIHICLKIIVLERYKTFLENKWDLFQFFMSALSIIFEAVSFAVPSVKIIEIVSRVISLSLLLLIIPRSSKLSMFLRFASASLPSLLSLLYTWFVVFLVYAIAMNQIFGLTKLGENGSNNLNFRTVMKTLLVLFKMSFGEGWNNIMRDYYLNAPYCTTDDGMNDCGNEIYAHILFMSWNIISMFIFLNLFVSLIVENFSYVHLSDGPFSLISREEIRKFKARWQLFDGEATGFINVEDLFTFLHGLDGVISFKLYDGRLSIKSLKNDWFAFEEMDLVNHPYYVVINQDSMKISLDSIDVKKVRHRKKQFQRFIEELLYDMKINNYPGISFSKIIRLIPLYTQFEDTSCLSLNDYLERHLLLQKLDSIIHKKELYYTRQSFVLRWRFLHHLKRKKNNEPTPVDSFTDLKYD